MTNERGQFLMLAAGLMLVVLISNSGFSREIRNGLLAIQNRFFIDMDALERGWQTYSEDAHRALEKIQSGDYQTGAVLLDAQHQEFEMILERRADIVMACGKTLREVHRTLGLEIRKHMDIAYLEARAAVSRGKMRPSEMRRFLNRVPFDYQNRLAIRWKNETPALEEARQDKVGRWIFVSVAGTFREAALFEDAIRSWIQENSEGLGDYRIVLGRPLGPRDAEAALRHISITFEGESVFYEFEGNSGKRRSSAVYETLHLRSEVTSKGNPMVRTSWDEMVPLIAHAKAPETIEFEFDKENQEWRAGFRPFIQDHQQALINALTEALDTWPVLKLEIEDSGEMATASRI